MGASRSLARLPLLLLVLIALAASSLAHEHHEEDVGPYEQHFTNDEEMDGMIKAHIGIQIACWGILFPAGMILGLTRSRFHAPFQALTVVLSLAGNYLGHHHSGRGFHMTAHAHLAGYLWWYMILQTACGAFLKLHVLEGTKVRRGVVLVHGVVGKSFPLVGWVQMLLGGIASLGFCFDNPGDHMGQCLAHFIMGGAFVGYAAILLIMLRLGAGWLARRKCSQELLDSSVIMLWGIINTFTMHNFLKPGQSSWNHKDLQHTSLGVLWWAGGALGIALSRNQRRSVVPAIIIAMTGYAMANHGQSLEFSTRVHQFFGGSLMAAGAARVIEICFVLKDAPTPSVSRTAGTGPKAFQHLTPFLLTLSGLIFLSSTEEMMQWVAGSIMDSTTYLLLLFSLALFIYTVGVLLVELYESQSASNFPPSPSSPSSPSSLSDLEDAGIRLRSPRRSSSPTLKVFGVTLPAPLVALVDFGRRLEGSNRSDASERCRHARFDSESMPLTASGGGEGRESVEGVEMARTESARERARERGMEESGSGSGTAGSEETVFELGEDDGGEGWWEEEKEREKEKERERRST